MEMVATAAKRRVLLADDDDDARSLIAARLRRAGIEVSEVRDGQALIEYICGLERGPPQDPPDVVISDVHMPGASGFEALAVIKRHTPETPVILVSAYLEPAMHVLAHNLGATAVYDKPVNLSELQETVVDLLDYGIVKSA